MIDATNRRQYAAELSLFGISRTGRLLSFKRCTVILQYRLRIVREAFEEHRVDVAQYTSSIIARSIPTAEICGKYLIFLLRIDMLFYISRSSTFEIIICACVKLNVNYRRRYCITRKQITEILSQKRNKNRSSLQSSVFLGVRNAWQQARFC